MNLYKYKGKRIRASSKNLVYRFCAGTLLLLFVAVLLFLNMEKLFRLSISGMKENGTKRNPLIPSRLRGRGDKGGNPGRLKSDAGWISLDYAKRI